MYSHSAGCPLTIFSHRHTHSHTTGPLGHKTPATEADHTAASSLQLMGHPSTTPPPPQHTPAACSHPPHFPLGPPAHIADTPRVPEVKGPPKGRGGGWKRYLLTCQCGLGNFANFNFHPIPKKTTERHRCKVLVKTSSCVKIHKKLVQVSINYIWLVLFLNIRSV